MGLMKNLKEEAFSKNTKIQSSEASRLEKIFNNLFYKEKNIKEETKFVKQVMTRGLESQKRVGLHASAMLKGDKDFCLRGQVLSLIYEQLQGEQVPIGLMRIFEEGNAIHEKWQRLIIRGGYGNAEDMDKTRFCEEYKMSYTPDIICEVPEFFDGKMIGEIKSVNTFQFKKMTKHPSAWKQCQWYMHLCIEEAKNKGIWNGKDFTKGFVLNDDKNTQDFKLEVYDYEPAKIDLFADRAEAIIFNYNRVFEKGKMIKRPDEAINPNCKKCKDCIMKDACWNIGMGRVKLEDS